MLGLSSSLKKAAVRYLTYIKNNLSLYLRFKDRETSLEFVGDGSTYFDGVDDYISFGTNASLRKTGDQTVMFWIKPVSIGGVGTAHNQYVVYKSDRDGKRDWEILLDTANNDLDVFYWDSSETADTSATTTLDCLPDQWTHVTCVFSQNEGKSYVYKNGVNPEIDTLSSGTWTSGRFDHSDMPVKVGGGDINGYEFNGHLKNVAIWSRALTASELYGLMYKSYDELGTSEKYNLEGWWALDGTKLGPELAVNGDFSYLLKHPEADINTENGWIDEDGWGGNNGRLSISTSNQRSGSQCAKFELTADGIGTGAANYYKKGLTIGKVYRASIWAKTLSGQNIESFEINASTLYAGYTRERGDSLVLNTEYQEASVVFKAEEESLRIVIRGIGAPNSYCFVDDLSIKEVESALTDLNGTNGLGTVGGVAAQGASDARFGLLHKQSVYGNITPRKPRGASNAPEAEHVTVGDASLYFDGTSANYLHTGLVRNYGDQVTITFWMRFGRIGAADRDGIIGSGYYSDNHFHFGHHDLGNSREYSLFLSVAQGDTQYWGNLNKTNNLNEWIHIALVYNNTESSNNDVPKLYRNGELWPAHLNVNGTMTGVDFEASGRISIGKTTGRNSAFLGNISQMGFWTRNLTVEEIKSVKDKTFAELTTDEKASLQHYWGMDSMIGSGLKCIPDLANTDTVEHIKVTGITNTVASPDGGGTAFCYFQISNSGIAALASGGSTNWSISGTVATWNDLVEHEIYKVEVVLNASLPNANGGRIDMWNTTGLTNNILLTTGDAVAGQTNTVYFLAGSTVNKLVMAVYCPTTISSITVSKHYTSGGVQGGIGALL